MRDWISITCLALHILTLKILYWSVIGSPPISVVDITEHEEGVLLNAFDEILHRRRRSDNKQVVNVKYKLKGNKSITELSQHEKDYLLHVHNAYRSTVEPYASNMRELVWDDTIEAFAREWAFECVGQHRPNRNLGSWINMGENLFWRYGGEYHEGMSAKWWWDEVKWYTYDTMKCVRGKLCGHYITMTWGGSDRIGCAVNRCPRLTGQRDYGRGAYYFVCNYNGQFISNKKPYVKSTTPCSRCYKTKFPKCRYNLCVTQHMLDNDIGYNGSTIEIGYNRTVTFSSRKTPTTTVITTTTTTTTPTTTAVTPTITTSVSTTPTTTATTSTTTSATTTPIRTLAPTTTTPKPTTTTTTTTTPTTETPCPTTKKPAKPPHKPIDTSHSYINVITHIFVNSGSTVKPLSIHISITLAVVISYLLWR